MRATPSSEISSHIKIENQHRRISIEESTSQCLEVRGHPPPQGGCPRISSRPSSESERRPSIIVLLLLHRPSTSIPPSSSPARRLKSRPSEDHSPYVSPKTRCKHFCLHPELAIDRCMVKAITIRLQIRLGMERFGCSNNLAQQLQNRCTESMSSDQSTLNDCVGPRAKTLQAKKMQMSNRRYSNRRGNKIELT